MSALPIASLAAAEPRQALSDRWAVLRRNRRRRRGALLSMRFGNGRPHLCESGFQVERHPDAAPGAYHATLDDLSHTPLHSPRQGCNRQSDDAVIATLSRLRLRRAHSQVVSACTARPRILAGAKLGQALRSL